MTEPTIDEKTATATRIIRENLYPFNPGMRFAYDAKAASIGVWNADLGRFQAVICYAITGQWVQMPYEIRVNGELPEKNWEEINPA